MNATQRSIVKALQSFTTCDVSDALLKLKHPHGGFLSGITLWSPERQIGATKIIGPAYTVKYVPVTDTISPKLTTHYIDTVPSGSTLGNHPLGTVPSGADPPVNRVHDLTVNVVYGGLMSNRAQASGAVGSIVDGRIRDLQEHRDLKYPVLLEILEPQVHMRSSESAHEVADRPAGCHHYPGDYLIGDLNGVVCLPKELAERAISLMTSQVEADEKIAADIQRGMTFSEASKKHRSGIPKP